MCHTPRLWSLTAAHVVMRLPEHCSRFLPTRSSATVHRFCPRVLHSEPPGDSHLPRPRTPTSPLQLSPQVSTTPVSAADDPAFQLTPKIKAAAKDFHNCPHHADPPAGLGPEDSGIFHTFPGQSRAVCTSKSSSSLVRHPSAESILEVLRTPSAPKLSCCGLSHSR